MDNNTITIYLIKCGCLYVGVCVCVFEDVYVFNYLLQYLEKS